MASFIFIKENLDDIAEELISEQIKLSGTRKNLDKSLFEDKDLSKEISVEDWKQAFKKLPDFRLDQNAVFNVLMQEYVNCIILENINCLASSYGPIPLNGYVEKIRGYVERSFTHEIFKKMYGDVPMNQMNTITYDKLCAIERGISQRKDPEITQRYLKNINKLFDTEKISASDDFISLTHEISNDEALKLDFKPFLDKCLHLISALRHASQPHSENPIDSVVQRLKLIGDYKTCEYMKKAYQNNK